MKAIRPKVARLRLNPISYDNLRQQVLRHKEFRSHSGHDSDENLITLCSACHASVHGWIE
jgi:5-methylcytosine-specific restriction endonuclease McrA